MQLPASLEEWRDAHKTARKRADQAQRLGYRFVRVLRTSALTSSTRSTRQHRRGRAGR
jgi:hypothetical protein